MDRNQFYTTKRILALKHKKSNIPYVTWFHLHFREKKLGSTLEISKNIHLFKVLLTVAFFINFVNVYDALSNLISEGLKCWKIDFTMFLIRFYHFFSKSNKVPLVFFSRLCTDINFLFNLKGITLGFLQKGLNQPFLKSNKSCIVVYIIFFYILNLIQCCKNLFFKCLVENSEKAP